MAENMSNALGETLALLVEGKKYTAARDVLETMHAADIAAMLEECRAEVVPLLFRLLPKELAADTFVRFEFRRLFLAGTLFRFGYILCTHRLYACHRADRLVNLLRSIFLHFVRYV